MEPVSLKAQHQRLQDLVLEQLMDWIMDGKLHMGQKLNTEDLAQQLGVSRMPVREALKSLERVGIVESIPYIGTRVVMLTREDARQIYIVRKALEPVAAFYACQSVGDEQIREVEKCQARLEEVMSQKKIDAKQIYNANRAFHFAIYDIAGLPRLKNMISVLWDNLAFYKLIYGLTYINSKESAGHMIEEHRYYIECLKNRDGAGLQAALAESLDRRIDDVPYTVSAYIEEHDGKTHAGTANKQLP